MATDVYTSLGEAYVVDAIDSAMAAPAIQSGIGTVAAAKGDTALGNTTGCPAKQTGGTKSQPAADTFQYVDTVAYTGTLAITEVGLFTDGTSGPLFQRHTFDPVNVQNGDSIQFTIQHQQN